MSVLTLFLVALGVSADAFAVALGKGLTMRRLQVRTAARLALAFGTAQAVMPLLGWLLGSQLERYVAGVDHWVAFGLLSAVGLSMVRAALSGEPDDAGAGGLGWRELLVLSVATSIDALAVGVSLAFFDVDVLKAVAAIGVTTTVLSFGGVALGQRAGARFRGPAEVAGGLVLIGIGVTIVLDHTGVL